MQVIDLLEHVPRDRIVVLGKLVEMADAAQEMFPCTLTRQSPGPDTVKICAKDFTAGQLG